MSWKTAADTVKQEAAKPPAGCQPLHDIAHEMGVSEEKAQEIVNTLIKSGRAERVPGKKLTALGALVPCAYYRLLGKSKSPSKKK
jgi:hypothetical protein